MKSFTLNQRQLYEDFPCGLALMDLVRLLKLPIREIKVCQKKTGTWSVKTQIFGHQENPKAGDINYGMIAHGRDMGINMAIHDAIITVLSLACISLEGLDGRRLMEHLSP